MKHKFTLKRCAAALLAAMTLVSALLLGGCGQKGFDFSRNISVVVREDGSGTKTAFMEIIGLKGKADVSGAVVATGTPAVLAEVKSNPLAIAYESLGYVTDEVKMLTVGGVAPTVANIKAGTYSIARPLQVVYKEDNLADPANAAFFAFLASETAQKIVRDNGYVSPVDGAAEYTVNPGLSGRIDISGSTSLRPLMVLLAAKFEEIQPDVSVTILGGGSGTGYADAENGTSDFGMISEVFSEAKAPSCKSYIVAKDGIAIIVNKENPLTDITTDALKKIYDPDAGENAVKTWAEVSR